MNANVKTHDLTFLEDLLSGGKMTELGEALDHIQGEFAPRVIVALTRTDDTTGEMITFRVFTNAADFASWREDFETVRDTSELIKYLGAKYKSQE